MKSRVERLLSELVALPSVNPAFLPPGHPNAGEKRVADFLAALAAKSGLDIDFQEVFPERYNLLARLAPFGKARQRVLLAPHLDIVNAAAECFTPRVRGGKLFGRGASDAKGPVAAMFCALCDLAERGERPKETEIIFAGLVDEEDAQAGSRALARSGFKANLGIVGEPTRLEVVSAHKGMLWLRLETTGRAAHGSRPELGINAVQEMAKVVNVLQTDYARQLRSRSHALLRSPTVNVGVIRGGTQANIVPDHCEIVVDRRTIPGESESRVKNEIGKLLRRKNLRATVSNGTVRYSGPMETNSKLPLVQLFLKSARKNKTTGVAFFCDGSVLSRGGIPCIVFGPGDIAQGHTTDEWISLASLERGQSILNRFLRSLP